MTQDSTRLGNILGMTVRGSAWLMDYAVPLTLVSAYRLIPAGMRGRLFGGPSTSLDAVRGLRAGLGWEAVRAAVSNHPPRPTPP